MDLGELNHCLFIYDNEVFYLFELKIHEFKTYSAYLIYNFDKNHRYKHSIN